MTRARDRTTTRVSIPDSRCQTSFYLLQTVRGHDRRTVAGLRSAMSSSLLLSLNPRACSECLDRRQPLSWLRPIQVRCGRSAASPGDRLQTVAQDKSPQLAARILNDEYGPADRTCTRV